MSFIITVSLFATAIAGDALAKDGETTYLPGCDFSLDNIPKDYWLCAAGSRDQMFKKNDLSAAVDLEEIKNVEPLIAVGPVEDLRGEITIYDGKPYISTLRSKDKDDWSQEISNSIETRAIFLAYGRAENWIPVPVNQTLSGLDEIEEFVRASALSKGLDLERPFPFKIEALAQQVNYHVIFKSDKKPHSMTEHKRAKIGFKASNAKVRIAGVWANKDGVGRYTHPGKRTHLHVVLNDNAAAGHVDDIIIIPDTTLYLPEVLQ